jgi:hypothetical protein
MPCRVVTLSAAAKGCAVRLDTPAAIAARLALLGEPHVAPIETLRDRWSAEGRRLPHVDPLDGGVEARLLVLLETPGPGDGSPRFVSRDNPTGTARNLARFLDGGGIARADVLLWNSVPWIVHAPGARNRPLRRTEIVEGLTLLPDLLAHLPRLRVVLLAGRVAAAARAVIAHVRPDLAIVAMPHPSPTYVCTSPTVPERIVAAIADAHDLLDR